MIRKFLNLFRRGSEQVPEQKQPPTLATKRHHYVVIEDRLEPRVGSLNEFYEVNALEFQTNEVLRTMQFAEELRTEDNSVLDKDQREGFVNLPEHGFTALPDQGYTLKSGEVHLTGNDESVTATNLADDFLGQDKTAIWDKQKSTFQITYRAESNTYPRGIPGSKSVIAREEFTTDASGKVHSQSENAVRVQRIIESSQKWATLANNLDNTTQDLNKKEKDIVAPNLARKSVLVGELENEKILSRAFEWGPDQDEQHPYQTFDIEHTKNSLYVAGSTDGTYAGASLWSEQTDGQMHIVVTRPEWGTIEKVHWNRGDEKWLYERLEKG